LLFFVGILSAPTRDTLQESGRNPEIVRLSRHGGGRAASVGCATGRGRQKCAAVTRFTPGVNAGILSLYEDRRDSSDRSRQILHRVTEVTSSERIAAGRPGRAERPGAVPAERQDDGEVHEQHAVEYVARLHPIQPGTNQQMPFWGSAWLRFAFCSHTGRVPIPPGFGHRNLTLALVSRVIAAPLSFR